MVQFYSFIVRTIKVCFWFLRSRFYREKVLYYLGKSFSSGVFLRFGLIWDFRVGVLGVISSLTDSELGATKSFDYLKPLGLLLLLRKIHFMF